MATGTKITESALLLVNQLGCSQDGWTARPLLDDISFQINTREHTAIIGHTGAGKSTLFACFLGDKGKLNGLQVKGSVEYNRRNLLVAKARNDEVWIDGGICWIPQEPETALNPTRTVKAQLLEMICSRLKSSRATANTLLRANFELTDHLALFAELDRYPYQFSGGELQRILIFHALVGKPGLVLADEPTTALDAENKHLIMSLLMNLTTATGATLVVSSHDYDTVRRYCKRFICLENGRLIETGPVSQLENRVTDNSLTSLLHDYDQLQLSQSRDIPAIPG